MASSNHPAKFVIEGVCRKVNLGVLYGVKQEEIPANKKKKMEEVVVNFKEAVNDPEEYK